MSIDRPKVGVKMEIEHLKSAHERRGHQLHHPAMHQGSHHYVSELELLNELFADGNRDSPCGVAVQLTEIVNVGANEVTHLVQVMLRPMSLLQNKDVRGICKSTNFPPSLSDEVGSQVVRAEKSHRVPGRHPDRGIPKRNPRLLSHTRRMICRLRHMMMPSWSST